MATESPGQRVADNKTSQLHFSPLDDPNIIHSLSTFCDLFMTSLGTQGHGKVIHNDCGGHVTLTSDCGAILKSLSVSKPAIKLVISAVKDHVHFYSDAGLLAMIFCLRLIIDALGLNINQRLVVDVYNIALKECVDFIESNQFPLKLNVNSNDVAMQLKLVVNMYKSKPVCLLFDNDLDHICHLTLDGYRKCNNSSDSPGDSTSLVYITVDGRPPCESKLLSGVLYESPQIPTYHRAPLRVQHNNQNTISVALVQTSMAGDSESFLEVTYELTSDLDMSATILTQLELFTDAVVRAGVGVLICQKVVHPRVKQLLKQQGVLVLDRLGMVLFDAVHKLAGKYNQYMYGMSFRHVKCYFGG
jgi:McKusick-Kaufman syndrome protein